MYFLAYAVGYWIGKTLFDPLSDSNIERVLERWTDVYSD